MVYIDQRNSKHELKTSMCARGEQKVPRGGCCYSDILHVHMFTDFFVRGRGDLGMTHILR